MLKVPSVHKTMLSSCLVATPPLASSAGLQQLMSECKPVNKGFSGLKASDFGLETSIELKKLQGPVSCLLMQCNSCHGLGGVWDRHGTGPVALTCFQKIAKKK